MVLLIRISKSGRITVCDDTQVSDELYAAGYMCDSDVDDSDTMNKKIRNAQLAQYNFILGTGCQSCISKLCNLF